jgi:hypothetical protein
MDRVEGVDGIFGAAPDRKYDRKQAKRMKTKKSRWEAAF